MKGVFISVAILGGFWLALLGIGFATGALPPGSRATQDDEHEPADPVAVQQDAAVAVVGVDAGDLGEKLPGSEGADDAAAAASPYAYDGDWTEPVCEPLTDVGDLRAEYTEERFAETVRSLAERRYPLGLEFIDAMRPQELRAWFQGTDAFDLIPLGFDTAVHEGSHIWAARRLGGRYHYRITNELTVEARRVRTFHRNEIKDHHVDLAADTYAPIYLDGASGRQGFDTLLDEYNAYAHSLASRYCTRDLMPSNMRTSARDGILTMMYYVGTYLRIARAEHPEVYQRIQAEPAYRDVIVNVWERARFWLAKSSAHDSLGVHDTTIVEWTFTEDNVAEIERVRQWNAAPDAGRLP